MASSIQQFLNKILSSRYGKDVRQAIHDGIKQCYSDVTNPDLNTEAFETAVQNKIDDGSLALLTIPDGSITKEKLDQDITENIETNTQDISDLKSEIGNLDLLETANNRDLVSAINEANQNSSGRLTDEIKQALLQIASKVAYVDPNGQSYYDDLYYSLYPEMDNRYSMYITVENERLKEGYIDDNGDFISYQTSRLIDKFVKALPFMLVDSQSLQVTNVTLRSAYYDATRSFLSRDYTEYTSIKNVNDPSAVYEKVGWEGDPNASYVILLNEIDNSLFTNEDVSIDASGELNFEANFHATDLIKFSSYCDKYMLCSLDDDDVRKVAFYDSNKRFISREYTGVTNSLFKYGDIPVDAVYYRASKPIISASYTIIMKGI